MFAAVLLPVCQIEPSALGDCFLDSMVLWSPTEIHPGPSSVFFAEFSGDMAPPLCGMQMSARSVFHLKRRMGSLNSLHTCLEDMESWMRSTCYILLSDGGDDIRIQFCRCCCCRPE